MDNHCRKRNNAVSINQSITYVEHIFVFPPFFLFSSFVYYELYRERNEKEKTNEKKIIYFASYSFVYLFIFQLLFFSFLSFLR